MTDDLAATIAAQRHAIEAKLAIFEHATDVQTVAQQDLWDTAHRWMNSTLDGPGVTEHKAWLREMRDKAR